jgi:hypothetical protein
MCCMAADGVTPPCFIQYKGVATSYSHCDYFDHGVYHTEIMALRLPSLFAKFN